MKLGLVTYQIAAAWDVPTIIKNCVATKFEGVELRTTHAHKVEIGLSKEERAEVKRRFEDSPVRLVSLGSTYEFHSPDPAVLRKNIDGTKQCIVLAHDVGAEAVKVRPNDLPREVDPQRTLEQIGKALRECGEEGRNFGIKVRLEVHGGCAPIPHIRRILDVADHPQVEITWNSNVSDLQGGTLAENLARVREKIGMVHMRDLYAEDYPWRELLVRLRDSGFAGYACAEIGESSDPLRVLRYFRALFIAHLQSPPMPR